MERVLEALAAWGEPEVVGPLSGNRNTVWQIRLHGRELTGQQLVARTSRREPASRTGRSPCSITWPATACGWPPPSRHWTAGDMSTA